jgi:hypothetical protein
MGLVTGRDQRLLVVLALLSSLCLLAEAAGMLSPEMLYAAPLLLVALPLLMGRYVGEDLISRRARAVRARRQAPPRLSMPAVALRALRSMPRGGRLIADSLAVRPPPALLVAS